MLTEGKKRDNIKNVTKVGGCPILPPPAPQSLVMPGCGKVMPPDERIEYWMAYHERRIVEAGQEKKNAWNRLKIQCERREPAHPIGKAVCLHGKNHSWFCEFHRCPYVYDENGKPLS